MSDLRLEILKNVRIASPCPMRWEDMTGDDKTRFCGHCQLNVRNFSAMTADEIQAVLGEDGRVCAGYFKRADGTILLQDCPVGLRLVRQRVARAAARAAAAAVLLVVIPLTWAIGRVSDPYLGGGVELGALTPFKYMYTLLGRRAPTGVQYFGGKVCLPMGGPGSPSAPPPTPPGPATPPAPGTGSGG